jgi:hypothetical protein
MSRPMFAKNLLKVHALQVVTYIVISGTLKIINNQGML